LSKELDSEYVKFTTTTIVDVEKVVVKTEDDLKRAAE